MSDRPLMQVIGLTDASTLTPLSGASLAGVLISDPALGTNLAAMLSIMSALNGNGAATPTLVSLTMSPSQILGQTDTRSAVQVLTPGEWTVNSGPAAGTRATVTRPAVAGGRNVLRSLLVTIANDGTAATVFNEFVVRDGAAGAGTIIYRGVLRDQANSAGVLALAGLNIVGSVSTAMSFEFLAAPDAGHVQRISASGIDAFAVV